MYYYGYGYIPYKQSNEDKCKVKYSHQRIKQILCNDYHYELIPINVGYKGNRRHGYIQKYTIRNYDTDEVVVEAVTLNALRILLYQEGYPLHEPMKPNQGAIAFLEYVENIKNQHNE